jgi:predicted DNA-binding protein YlxM (UPF0122 family)
LKLEDFERKLKLYEKLRINRELSKEIMESINNGDFGISDMLERIVEG